MAWTHRLTLLLLAAMTVTWQSAIGQNTNTTNNNNTNNTNDNLLVNPSFEEDLKGTWFGGGSTIERVATSDVPHGNYALKCSNRLQDIDGPLQKNVTFLKGRHYAFEGYVKLLNDVTGKPWQTVKAIIQGTTPDSRMLTYNIAFRSFCDVSQGWIHLKGDIDAPQIELSEVRLAIRGPEVSTDFLVDNLTLRELPEDPDWRTQADRNIENHRKANVQINVNLPAEIPASEVNIEVALRRHWFAFGAMIRDDVVREEPTSEVMKMAYYLFEWATVQSYKWKYNKGNPPATNPDFSDAVEATDILLANGMKVRGHSVFWNLANNIPEWVLQLKGEQLRSTLYQHLNYMIELARGKLQQWDIMNEHIAGHYYENALHEPDVTKNLHTAARALGDPARIYMNEFQAVTSGAQTEQYHDIAKEYLREEIPLDGLGIQGHVKDFVKPDPTAMWRRIDRLAETGLELMMTEFDLGWPDKIQRADWFEDAIRAFFGHPRMRGVILWDFWNHTMRERDHELVEGLGADLKIVEAGQRWACLVKKEWNTNLTFNLADHGTTLSFRGFQGDYIVTVRRNTVPVQKAYFSLRKQDKAVDLTVTPSTKEVNVPVEHDYVPQCISHREQRSVGTGTTSATRRLLACRTVSSATSGLGENEAVSISCGNKEVMTSCSSYHTTQKQTRNGEKMELNPATGKMQCTAYNGHQSTGGVRAYARCCKVAGLKCDYRTAGPSFPFDGAMAEANCSKGHMALGCSSYSPFPDSDGVRPNSGATSCLAQSGAPVSSVPGQKSGVYAYSACCKASIKLRCLVHQSQQSALTSGNSVWVTCPSRYVMTGCNAFADSGKSAGARILSKDGVLKCRAYLGEDLPPGSQGVVAYATCCRTEPVRSHPRSRCP